MSEITQGKTVISVSYAWTTRDSARTLVLTKGERSQFIRVDEHGAAVAWEKPGLVLARTGDVFELTGSNGEHRMLAGRPLPWYQSLPQLAWFVAGDDRKVQFLAFPDNFGLDLKAGDLTVFEAKKIERVKVNTPIGAIECWKVHVTFADFRAMFWGGDYWFRATDGLLVRYEEVRGAPGTPKTVGLIGGVKP